MDSRSGALHRDRSHSVCRQPARPATAAPLGGTQITGAVSLLPILWALPTLQGWPPSGLPAVPGGDFWLRSVGRDQRATRRRARPLLWPIIVCQPQPSDRAQSGESNQVALAGIAGAAGLRATDGCRHRDDQTGGLRRIKFRRLWRRLGWSGGGDGCDALSKPKRSSWSNFLL